MKPKEKAKELVNKFMFTSFNIQENTDDFKFKLLIQAKQCALIAVEFAREFITGDLSEAFDKFIYLQDIKEEIEKL